MVRQFTVPNPMWHGTEGPPITVTFERYRELVRRFRTVQDVIQWGIEVEESMGDDREREVAACILFALQMVKV